MKSLLTRSQCLIALSRYLVIATLVLALAPLVGTVSLDLRQILTDLSGPDPWHIDTTIFIKQRIPRVLLAFLVGGSLAVVGCVFQVVLSNPLAAPATLGVTGGGALGAVVAIFLPNLTLNFGPLSTIQLLALTGAAIVLLFIYLLARRPHGVSTNTLLLAGVTFGILCSALSTLIRYLATPNLLVAIDRWMMGGLDIINYAQLGTLFPLLIPGLGLLFILSPKLNHLALGPDLAAGHGIDVPAVQRLAFLGGGITTAAVVSVAGPITFVGLIIPHITRRLSGYDQRLILPASLLTGGAFLALCDAAARTLIPDNEIPVGILTAITGGPFFIHLLLKRNSASM